MRFFLGLVVVIFFLCCTPVAYAQQYEWVKTGGTNQITPSGYRIEASYLTTTDNNGNIYSLNRVGNSGITADTFYMATGYGANDNILLTSYDCTGNMRWAKLIGSYTGSIPLGLTTDSLGHLYLGGAFPHGIFHIGADTAIPSATSNQVAALIQFDTLGHFNWIRWVGPNTATNFYATNVALGTLALDGLQNVHYLKAFRTGSQITPSVVSIPGNYDLTYDVTGALLDAKLMQLDTTWKISGASVDFHTGKLYAFGYPSGYVPSDHGNFVAAFDINRNRLWMDSMVDITIPGAGGFYGIAYDNNGHIYLSGGGNGTIAYRGDSVFNNLLSLGATSFVMKVDTLGDPLWMRGYAATTGVNWFNGLTITPRNKIAVTGVMAGLISSDDGVSVSSYSGEGQNTFFSLLDTGGHINYIQQIHGSGFYDGGNTISSDRIGNLFIGGNFSSNVWGGSLTPATTLGGDYDFFVMKYGVDCGCLSMPIASFTHTGSPVVSFTYTGTTPGIDSVRWYFGDGGTAAVYNPAHTYTAAGIYHASVKVFSPCGDDIFFGDITVPCVGATASSFTDTGLSLNKYFSFTGPTFGLDSVSWAFGDGSHGTGFHPMHTYAPGTYNVCATAYNPCGATTSCLSITVINCAGIPSASFTQSGAGAVRSFAYTGSTSYIDSVVWRFGDGGHATGTTSSHTYMSAGTFTACVIVYTACGWDSSCLSLSVPCTAAPISAFTSAGLSATRSFTYTGTSTGIDSVAWTFGDGGHATGLTPSHTYLAAGTYNVCATAYNHCGSNAVCHTVVITCVSTLSPAYTHNGFAPMAFNYSGATTGMDSVVWHYGDGGRGTGLASTHTYASTGAYTACALIYNHCGVDSVCSTFTVPCVTPPLAAFTASGTTGTRSFTYTGTTAALDSIVWDYGDSTRGLGMTTAHTYSAAGTYTVCVTAYSPCGSTISCSFVSVGCIAAPTVTYTSSGSPIMTYNYTGPAGGLDSVVWSYGDGNHGTGTTVSHLYPVADTYMVCVTAYNHCGWDSICSNVIVTCPAPVASFTHTGAPAVSFSYTGTAPAADSIVWHYGDGFTDTGMHPVHTYASADTYHVCVTAYSLCGFDTACMDIMARGVGISTISLNSINVYPNPATNELKITGIVQQTDYRILTITGIAVQSGALQSGANNLSLADYSSGIYLLELTGKDGIKKIVRVIKE